MIDFYDLIKLFYLRDILMLHILPVRNMTLFSLFYNINIYNNTTNLKINMYNNTTPPNFFYLIWRLYDGRKYRFMLKLYNTLNKIAQFQR